MKKVLMAVLATFGMVFGSLMIASPAMAHAGNITAAAVCDTATGQYKVTYTLTWSNVPDGVTAPIFTRTGSTSFHNGWNKDTWSDWTDRGATSGKSGSINWTETMPGNTTGNGPWIYATTIWSNNHNGETKHDTRIEGLKGNCEKPPVVIPNSIETWHTETCGSAEIFLRNVSPWIYPVSVEVDGVHSYGPTVDNRTDGKLNGPQKDVTKSKIFTFPEDSGTHTIRYRVDAGSENQLYKNKPVGEWTEFTVESDCIPPQPEDLVTYTDWVDGTYQCGDKTVTQTRTKSVTTYTLVDKEWVASEPEITEETQIRNLTQQELDAMNCLASTGSDVSPAVPIGAGAALLLGITLMLRKRLGIPRL